MNLVGLKELSELLEVPYEKLKVWKSRGRLPEPFQTISGTLVWDWDEVEDEFRAIPQNENSGRPKRPRISLAGGLIDIDVKKNDSDSKDASIKISMFGKQIVDIETDGNESDESGKKVSIKVMGKSVIDGYTDFIQEDSEESDNEDS